MTLQIIFFSILTAVLNFLLYLSMNFNEHISYLILNFLIFLNFISIFLYKKLVNKNNKQPKKEITAEDHPIIKAARERLSK
ncbi:MAG: hypothetical protein CMM98_03440 [Rickettsiales bacterium]|nr:hypothetical protein [Rickettsiales bacterium]